MWTFSTNSSQWLPLVTSGPKGHNRLVFTLTLFEGGTKMISTSMDRSLILWDISATAIATNGNAAAVTNPSSLSEIEAEGHIAGMFIHTYYICSNRKVFTDEINTKSNR